MASIRELCLAALQTQLAAIIAGNASPPSGALFAGTVDHVRRWEQEGPVIEPPPAIIICPRTDTPKDEPLEQASRLLVIDLAIYLQHDKVAYPGPTDGLITQWLRDVELALWKDRTLGGNADDLDIGSEDYFYPETGQPYCGALVELTIKYRTSNLNPDVYV